MDSSVANIEVLYQLLTGVACSTLTKRTPERCHFTSNLKEENATERKCRENCVKFCLIFKQKVTGIKCHENPKRKFRVN